MKKIILAIQARWEQNPLVVIMFLGIFVRCISILFAKGWGMLDDHFLVIEVSQSWADGLDVKKWLPWTPGNKGPEGHSFLYVGLHYLFFSFFKWIGFNDPQGKMYVIRTLHAAWSLITVYYGYKITLKLSNKKTAGWVGLFLALYWFMPWLSVRNLVEIVATPLLILGTWMLMNADEKKYPLLMYILAGLIAGFAFSVRYQTGIYSGALGLVLLLQKRIKPLVAFALGNIVAVFLIQGVIDMAIWGRPFAEMGEYIQYNIDNKYNFIKGDWYSYILLLAGILIPPVSIFLLVGMFVDWKKNLLIFLPTMAFLLFHSYFPNKQERFILTIVPFIIIIGTMGWMKIRQRSTFWQNHPKLHKGIFVYFWILNLLLLIPISTMYSKRSRAEAMTYLYRYKNVKEILVENTNGPKVDIVPQSYAGQQISCTDVTTARPIELDTNLQGVVEDHARFVLFITNENLEKRVREMRKYYPHLVYETTVEPGFMDKVMYWMNPTRNTNQTIYIYRNAKYIPKQKEE